MAVLVGVFDAEEAAERAYVRLQEAGVPQSQIALISNVMGSSVQSRPTTAAELQAEQSADAISIRPAEGLEMATPHDGDPEGMRRVPAEHADVAPEVSDNPGLDAAALGAAIGALAPTTRVAQAAASALYFPTLFLSGAAMPRENLPDAARTIGDFLPLTYVVDGLRDAWAGAPLAASSVLIPLAAVVLGAAISLRAFRWS